ncbi:threonine ammonia-lyase [Helicobacter sp. MIT 14-3879]|uniref:threonine ammonia-lyase n=1 Tax=Helicobacter sp. MIT 14-3879 TaxID=2040649 RepID=UPI000E1EC33C|nr:threonine ammonia-lyase [Helicobacter sp. MIT 14-3879]RDU60928.1 threonine ammonia-lyase [Helicobacter sp. MIT 14-3879]
MIDLELFKNARDGLRDIIVKTELSYAPRLSEIAKCNIFLKKENLQKTGAYKIRGAYNRISKLSDREKKLGVVAASAGNHAQGVAFSSKHFGIRCVIVMPEATPLLKVVSTKALDAEVILAGENYDEAYQYAIKLSKEQGLEYIHPFADDDVIVGQGTIGLEMIEEKKLDYVIIPVGGGGLICGISNVYKNLSPNTKIIGVVAQGARAMYDSFRAKKACNSKSVHTIADGIAVRDVNKKNLDIILECVDDIIMVDDEEIANAVLFLLEKQKLVVEGAGAVGVAAMLHNKIPKIKQNDNIGIVLSGGNVDVTMLSLIIEKGLIKSHRKMQFKTILIDKPGSLKNLTDILCKAEANIIKIDYNRISTTIDYGDAIITMTLETKGLEHQDEIREKLSCAGYKIDEFY